MTKINGQEQLVLTKQVLSELGLSSLEVMVYLELVQHSKMNPATLAKKLKVPRTTMQNILLRLERKGFVSVNESKNTLSYNALHPENLFVNFQKEKNDLLLHYNKLEDQLKTVIPEIIGVMQTSKSIPQVRFFQGLEGVRAVLFDTLTSKTELKDFANIDAMFDVIKEVNDDYVSQREKTNIVKRSLLLDTKFARKVYESGKYSPKSHKGYKWIPESLYPFVIEMNIYDGKVSYLTYVKNEIIGVIIENDYIYQMHNSMWNLVWDLLPCPELNPNRSNKQMKKH